MTKAAASGVCTRFGSGRGISSMDASVKEKL